MTPSSPLLPLRPWLLSKLCKIFFLFLWVLSSDFSFSQFICHLCDSISQASFLCSVQTSLFGCPIRLSMAKTNLIVFLPKPTALCPVGRCQGMADTAAPTVAQAISLGITHSLSAPQQINYQVLSSLSLGSLSTLLSAPPLGPGAIYLSSKWPRQLLTHLSVHYLPFVCQRSRRDLSKPQIWSYHFSTTLHLRIFEGFPLLSRPSSNSESRHPGLRICSASNTHHL